MSQFKFFMTKIKIIRFFELKKKIDINLITIPKFESY